MENDRRKYRRIEKRYLVEVKTAGSADQEQKADISTLINMSKAGILFSSIRRYWPGDAVDMKIKSFLGAKAILCYGVIVRCDPSKHVVNAYEVGVKLTQINIDDIDKFNKAIEFFLEKEKRHLGKYDA